MQSDKLDKLSHFARLPSAVVSYVFSFCAVVDNSNLLVTSQKMQTIGWLKSSSPHFVQLKNSTWCPWSPTYLPWSNRPLHPKVFSFEIFTKLDADNYRHHYGGNNHNDRCQREEMEIAKVKEWWTNYSCRLLYSDSTPREL